MAFKNLESVLTVTALHAYACDCITHHLFHPYGTDCITKKEDEEMMHQVAADDSLQSKLSLESLKPNALSNMIHRSPHLALRSYFASSVLQGALPVCKAPRDPPSR